MNSPEYGERKLTSDLVSPLIYYPNGCSLFDAWTFDAHNFYSRWIDWMFVISLHFMPMMRNVYCEYEERKLSSDLVSPSSIIQMVAPYLMPSYLMPLSLIPTELIGCLTFLYISCRWWEMDVMNQLTWVWRKEIKVRLSEPPHLSSKWLLLIWCLNIWYPQFWLPMNWFDVYDSLE